MLRCCHQNSSTATSVASAIFDLHQKERKCVRLKNSEAFESHILYQSACKGRIFPLKSSAPQRVSENFNLLLSSYETTDQERSRILM